MPPVEPVRLSPAPAGLTTTSPTVEANSAVKLRPRVSEKISEPPTNATPSTIANVLMSSRSLRPSRLFAVALSIARTSDAVGHGGHPRHDLEHLVAVGVARLVDDPAVGEEHDPVRVGG